MSEGILKKLVYGGLEWTNTPYEIEDRGNSAQWWVLLTNVGYNFAPVALYRTEQSYDDAYAALWDIAPTVPESELYEAYGFNKQEHFDKYLAFIETDKFFIFTDREKENYLRELAPGYYSQSNATGTGVIYLGEDWRCEPYNHRAEKEAYNKRFL